MNRKKRAAKPDAPDAFGVQDETGTAANAKKQPRGLTRKMLLAVCTGVLALAFSAIPALALWLNDAQLLAQPHERTRQAGALALTSDDLYLTRILKKYAQRDTLTGYRYASFSPDAMSWTDTTVLLEYLDTLYEAGVLPADWRTWCIERIDRRAFTSQDSLGFIHYIAYVEDENASDYACYLAGITVEAESQKVIALFVSSDFVPVPSATEKDSVLAAYRSYLGLDTMEDWTDPTDTWFAGSALYSPRAELMLYYETGTFQAISYQSYDAFNGSWRQESFARNYLCLHALSLPEETVHMWQDYARSFPAGTNVWGRADPYADGGRPGPDADAGGYDSAEWSGEEALG